MRQFADQRLSASIPTQTVGLPVTESKSLGHVARSKGARLRKLTHSLRLRRKLFVSIAVAVVTGLVLPTSLAFSARTALAWSAGGLAYLAIAAALMSSCTADDIHARAQREDEARYVFFGLILMASALSFIAVFTLIGDAKTLTGGEKAAHIALAAVTVIVSWLITQVVFTLHYAHEFYMVRAGGDAARGLRFPDDNLPDYWDFFYFTTSIGATSQTSDVAVTSKRVRHMVTFQAILSFGFNTTIVALAINLASGLA